MEFNEIKKRFMLRCFSMRLADTTIKAYEEFFHLLVNSLNQKIS